MNHWRDVARFHFIYKIVRVIARIAEQIVATRAATANKKHLGAVRKRFDI